MNAMLSFAWYNDAGDVDLRAFYEAADDAERWLGRLEKIMNLQGTFSTSVVAHQYRDLAARRDLALTQLRRRSEEIDRARGAAVRAAVVSKRRLEDLGFRRKSQDLQLVDGDLTERDWFAAVEHLDQEELLARAAHARNNAALHASAAGWARWVELERRLLVAGEVDDG